MSAPLRRPDGATTAFVILGAGTAGTIMANRLATRYAEPLHAGLVHITVVDQDCSHIYQPGLLFVPFGVYTPEEIVKPREAQLPRHVDGVKYLQATIEQVDVAASKVLLEDGVTLPYDILIVATGTRIVPEETEGLTGTGWREKVFDFYTLAGATALHEALERFERGHLVVNVIDMPIKCPVAPLEFAFLADWYFTQKGRRDDVQITYVTPLDGAFTKPVAAEQLSHLLTEKRIDLVPEFAVGQVDGAQGKLVSWDEREVPFDLLVTIPLHRGAEYVARSEGLGDDLDFVKVDARTLQAKAAPNIFALGDATDAPTSKAGSVAHFEAELLMENIDRALRGEPVEPTFDGHANCFIETGHNKALLIDFNYDTEPLPGSFPFRFGPMKLLEESRLNHLGKLAFRWVYWNMLLPGHDLPGISPQFVSHAHRDDTVGANH
ncbi:type III sulfide quinone reductase, selenoprotein subtype [Gemmatimonas sp.]